MKITALELCSGAGGQALGFEAAGFEHVALIDNNPHSCATLRMNRPYWNVIQADITRLDVGYWKGEVDVVAAGLPCPPFSVASKQLGTKDERNLFPAFLRIVAETGPRAVVVENVKGLMQRRFESYRKIVDSTLKKLGYEIHWELLDALDQGVPQTRTRTFMVAIREPSKPFVWPVPNGSGKTVGDVLGDMMAENGWSGAKRWAKRANRPAPTLVGGSHKHGGPDLGPTRARQTWAELGVDGLGIADAPPPPRFQGMPRLTVGMAAKLQTFPDEWSLAGSKTQRYRQVGNALPPRLACSVARSIAQCLK